MCADYVELCVGDCFFKIWLDFFHLLYYSKNIKTIKKIEISKKCFLASELAQKIPGTGLLWFSDLVTERNKTFPLFFRKMWYNT